MTSGTALANLSGRWQSVAGAWLAEVQQRTGSDRTPRNPAEKPCCDEMRWRITSGLGQVRGIG